MVSNTGEIWFLFLSMSRERGQERYLALKDSITLKGLAQRGQENVCVCAHARKRDNLGSVNAVCCRSNFKKEIAKPSQRKWHGIRNSKMKGKPQLLLRTH